MGGTQSTKPQILLAVDSDSRVLLWIDFLGWLQYRLGSH